MSENQTGVTVTLKAGTGFEAPWIVIHAESVTDAKNQIDSGNFATLAERAVSAAEFFRSTHNVRLGLPAPGSAPAAQPQQQSWSNQGSQQDAGAGNYATNSGAPQGGFGGPPTKYDLSGPPGPSEKCVHGDMDWRHRKSKAGNEYKGWFCKVPEAQGGCKAKFLR